MTPNKPRQKFITYATYDQWERQCKGKYKHLTEEAAEKHRVLIEAHEGNGAKFNKYQCPFCTRWHVGHDRRNLPVGTLEAAKPIPPPEKQ